MDRRTTIAESLLTCKPLTSRYFKGFDDTNHTRQAPGLPNHLAWSLGHCALIMHIVAEKIDGHGVPEAEFIKGSATNDAGRFGTDAVKFGSAAPRPGDVWPSLARSVAIYDGAIDRLATAIKGADDAKLDTPAKWGAGEVPLWQLCQRMMFHNGTHVGQVVDLRRALGMGSAIG